MVGVNLQGTDTEAVSELRMEQVLQALVNLVGIPPLSGINAGMTGVGRVQSNLNLGGNTDLLVRPKPVMVSA